jgi:transposase
LADRARIVLRAADGASNQRIAEEMGLTYQTVGKWRRRFTERGVNGLHDEPRPGQPRTVNEDKFDEILSKTLESMPKNKTHWSTRSMAAHTGVSRETVRRLWNLCGLKPHRQDTFKLSTDPYFVEKVKDIVGLYMSPPQNAVVLCVDEKSQVQALDRTQPLLPHAPGYPEQRTHDYERHGTTSLFAALNVLTGEVIGRCHRQHRHQEFLKFLKHVHSVLPDDEGIQVHVIMDNYGTHKTPKVAAWLAQRNWHIHFTPTSASWLNEVERFFAKITVERIRRGTFTSVRSLEKAIHDYVTAHNLSPRPFAWTATAEEIFAKLGRLCKRTTVSGH